MENPQIAALLTETLGLSEVHVDNQGTHYTVMAIGECFEGLSRVKRQQIVYAPLSELIADGTIHAVSIKTFTPVLWQREKKLNLSL